MEPFIHRENIPGELLSIFKKGRKTATEWESLITQAVLSKSTFEDEEEERRPRDEDTENDDGVDEDFGETSTIRSGAGDGGGDDIEINFEWDYDKDKGRDWFTMAQAHRRAIKLLANVVRTTSKTTATEMRALERRIKADQGPEDQGEACPS